jgi:hypothetical protein
VELDLRQESNTVDLLARLCIGRMIPKMQFLRLSLKQPMNA